MRWLLLSVLLLQVATCGQKGPLTLPEHGAATVHASAERG